MEDQRELELQFSGSVVHFSSLTIDTGKCLGQGDISNTTIPFGTTYVIVIRGTTHSICTLHRISSFPGAFGKVYSGTMDIAGKTTVVAIKTIKSKAKL